MANTKPKYLLFIVETRKNAKTDDAYIKETIKKFFVDSYDFQAKFIYMESKSAYNSQKVKHEIKEYVNHSNVIGIVLCVDTDDYDSSVHDNNLNEKIKNHCTKKGYEFVWFFKNVEDVYYFNTNVEKNKKVIKAKQFIQNGMISNIDEKYLRGTTFAKRYSNILTILEKYYKK